MFTEFQSKLLLTISLLFLIHLNNEWLGFASDSLLGQWTNKPTVLHNFAVWTKSQQKCPSMQQSPDAVCAAYHEKTALCTCPLDPQEQL